MKKRISFVLLLTVFVFSAVSALSQGQTIYNSIPAFSGNVVSLGFESDSTYEFGNRIQFSTGSGRRLLKVTQLMSSWGCESGHWYSYDCSSTPGSTFTHPITLNIYNVGPGGSVGSLITSVTQSFAIPYRPSVTFSCGDGRWRNASDGNCYNGYGTAIEFNLPAVSVPNQIIYSIGYNTSHHGYSPMGEATSCYSSSGGCGYDSLNVGLEGAPSVGAVPSSLDAYNNTTFAPYYCDGGVGGVGVFRLDAGCYSHPDFSWIISTRFNASNPPGNANDCKNGGWQTQTRLDGSSFKNQGDCIQYVNTGR